MRNGGGITALTGPEFDCDFSTFVIFNHAGMNGRAADGRVGGVWPGTPDTADGTGTACGADSDKLGFGMHTHAFRRVRALRLHLLFAGERQQ